jgi:hypothetical protein
MYVWMDGWMDVWMDGWMDVRVDVGRTNPVLYLPSRLEWRYRFLMVHRKVNAVLDGVARSLAPRLAVDDTLKDTLAPRVRAWHSNDGNVVMVISLPKGPEVQGACAYVSVLLITLYCSPAMLKHQ